MKSSADVDLGRRSPPGAEVEESESPSRAVECDDTDRADPLRRIGPLAPFGPRAVGFLIDGVIPVIALGLVLSVASSSGAQWWLSITVLGCLVLLTLCIWNSGYLQGTTGRSLGRRAANTMLIGAETGRPVGVGPAVARQLCHVLEFGIGFLWPLWDSKRQTFADKIIRTVVVQPVGSISGSTRHLGCDR